MDKIKDNQRQFLWEIIEYTKEIAEKLRGIAALYDIDYKTALEHCSLNLDIYQSRETDKELKKIVAKRLQIVMELGEIK